MEALGAEFEALGAKLEAPRLFSNSYSNFDFFSKGRKKSKNQRILKKFR